MTAKHCPNCGGVNTEQFQGDKLLCIDCNVTYEIKIDGSATAVDTDPLGKITDRVYEKIKNEKPAAPAAPDHSSTVDLQDEDDGI